MPHGMIDGRSWTDQRRPIYLTQGGEGGGGNAIVAYLDCSTASVADGLHFDCSTNRDAALASMAVKVMQLEGLLSSKQAQLHEMGATEQTWLEDAQKLRDAVANTLGALGKAHRCTPYQPAPLDLPLLKCPC